VVFGILLAFVVVVAGASEATCNTRSCNGQGEETVLVQRMVKRHEASDAVVGRPVGIRPGDLAMPPPSPLEGQLAPPVKATSAAAAVAGARTFTLVKMSDKATSMGAICLDGTPGAFYISPSPSEHQHKKEWVIHLQGGGWCYDGPTCYNRSAFLGGSSSYAVPTQTAAGLGLDGQMSDNCTVNPTFCNFNLVMAWYCDGASFAGNKEDPVVYTDPKGVKHNLWFRGRRILEAILDTLVEEYGLGNASRVLLGGDSAGGMAAYLHANYIEKKLLTARMRSRDLTGPMDYRVAPNSGFFLYHNSVEMKQVFQMQITYLYYMSNVTITDNRCLDRYSNHQLEHLCMFPQHVYPHINAPTFVLNSALDLYQAANILSAEPISGFPNWENSQVSFFSNYNASAVPGWINCTGGMADITGCSKANIAAMNGYMDTFERTIVSTAAFNKSGNGAFIYGCFNHNAELNSLDWGLYTVDGVVMRDAVAQWWDSPAQSAGLHTHVERGRYKYPATVKDANPTCNSWLDGLR